MEFVEVSSLTRNSIRGDSAYIISNLNIQYKVPQDQQKQKNGAKQTIKKTMFQKLEQFIKACEILKKKKTTNKQTKQNKNARVQKTKSIKTI